jgi:hypothetical protein
MLGEHRRSDPDLRANRGNVGRPECMSAPRSNAACLRRKIACTRARSSGARSAFYLPFWSSSSKVQRDG